MIQRVHDIANLIIRHKQSDDVGLLTGLAGEALFLYKYANTLQLDAIKNNANEKLHMIFDLINEGRITSFTYAEGLSGVGWLIEYLLIQKLLVAEDGDIMQEADELLGNFMIQQMHEGDYDFLHNAGGIALYFLKRIQKTHRALPFLKQYIKELLASSEDEGGMKKWTTPINMEDNIKGYDISIAHGSSSIVVLLSKLLPIISTLGLTNLLENTVNYILHQEYPRHARKVSFFPTYNLQYDNRNFASRLGWCYGDLGIAIALYQAGQVLQRQDWTNKAIEVLLYAAAERRNLQKNMVVDAGLCHGTAGIGHIFYRMWWHTRFSEFKNAADYWFNETLKMARFEDGLVGFKALHGEDGWINEYGLINGIAGIGLAMLSYITETEPTWDECLLLS
ncbi:MAG: lanthionine synthetase C family protein [Bacteroidales bacterium]|nr:lanthionine synthetase C family protein [Bacteroidales bacterium]